MWTATRQLPTRPICCPKSLLSEFGEHIVHLDLLPIGAPRRDWQTTVISDGIVMLRHPDLDTTIAMADRVGNELRMFAG